MFVTYEEALEWIHSRLRLGIKPGLKRMEVMMNMLGHPEKDLKTVHVGGTNGKGSTVTYLRSILQEANYSVGTFTSPYIEHFNERISVDGIPISDREIMELVNVIYPLAVELEDSEWGGPTEFEVITAMSMYYFSKVRPVDVVIYEVGLGGRFDSTNIISPLLSIITNIGLDHTNILGETHEKIAFEKAGIIKRNTPIITGVSQQDALNVIEKQANEMEAQLFRLIHDIVVYDHSSLPRGESFSLKTPWGKMENLAISMIGYHQTENAALAISAARYLTVECSFNIGEAEIRKGLESSYWPGRFEILNDKPEIIIDGAHNEEGITVLVNELKNRYGDKKIHIMFAALKDKKLDKMIEQLDEIAYKIMFVSFDFPRAARAAELSDLSQSENKRAFEDWQTVLNQEIVELGLDEILVVTGSLYFISTIKPHLCKFFKK
ncbi:MAG: folylpolyglutamate synthase/dihydrofolate synthase family protein [Bacillota bacterium]|nr:folylpolyglutamate synthase/dihydrofolate synthase family protein [Bacillota bacterium]